ncbi:response regulator transcription factor [Ruminiclostridium cellulolyticum]|uniref:Stage 0 sporulation protein A homolog n=1 Tax=Ruminiclostridium cellulolyticum (strain ATCC 35319 / DSM 5812 / JCM 6584 / H10) TaxID=394503 RepID=B8I0N2_RUMCH|nr:response regulator [Ruminiclostridium cellulolyticum]ACL75607.1 two component transcriptional regulator, AraC family [Ruminiclostridium cellulolyticum H10]
MYRLLIVDDEEIIVNGLYEIFRSLKNLDLDVYRAYSGEEAVEWLSRTRMDIVLTDIRMPEMDGLQLLDVIYRRWPQCKVIFLTGYNEFEYVYKAIQHQGVSYILKTEDNDKVISVVENAIEEIKKEIKTEDLIHNAKEQIELALGLFQKDYFIHLLHEENSSDVNKAQFEQLAIPMYPDHPVILLLGHIDSIPGNLSYWDKIQYINSIKVIITKNLNTNIRSICILDDRYRFIFFIQPNELMTTGFSKTEENAFYDKAISFVKGTLEVIQTACMESLNASISFSLSGEPCNWEDVSKKYFSLNQLLNYKIGTGTEMLLIDNELKNNILASGTEVPELDTNDEPLEILLRRKNMDLIQQYMESGQKEKYFEVLEELLTPIKSVKSKNSNLAIEAYSMVSLSILSYINRWKITEKLAFHIGLNSLMRIDKHETWSDAVKYLINISDIIFQLQTDEQKKRADNAVDFVQSFINEHLSEDLSLVRLAEQVYLNPSYLSRLYKQVTNTNLSDFIDNARIERAKELLKKEKVKINEVAKAVGYETAASFTRFFKKLMGCSPQEYHDTMLSGK